MLIGRRLREIRESKHLSQGDIEKRTGLLRCYTPGTRSSDGVLFYDGEKPQAPELPRAKNGSESEWGSKGKDARLLRQFCRVIPRTNESDQKLLLYVAQKMASASRTKIEHR
jgi:hypothetical protein